MEKFTIQKERELPSGGVMARVDVESYALLEDIASKTNKSKRVVLAEMIRFCYSRLEIIDNSFEGDE